MRQAPSNWTFFTNHGHIYFLIATQNNITVREIASKVGITERSVLGIIQDLEDGEYISREKVGRTNKYKVGKQKTLRHPLESKARLKDLVEVISR